jgi:IS1 family transposase
MRKPKDWGHPCPTPACSHYRRMQQGNVRALAPYLPQSGKRRILRCHTCETPFSETRATVLFARRTSADKIMMALKMLLVRVDLAGLSFVLGVTEATVLGWLRRAAHHADASNRPLLRALPVTQGQLDEMGHFIARKHAGETDAAGESGPASEDGRQWVWRSFAPAFRLMIAAIVGPRTLDTAKEVVAATQARVAGIPAFFRDGFTCYLAALLAAFHVVTTLARTGKRGRPRKPRCEPHPALVYGQWVQQKKQGQLLTLSTRVVRGADRLTQLGLTLSPALVERVHLPLRQALAPWARKTSSFCKDRERMRQRVVLCQGFDNMARPHLSWRQPLPPHERTCRGAIQPRWRERTPAMAAGLTDHVWTLRELLTAKCEPLNSQSSSG